MKKKPVKELSALTMAIRRLHDRLGISQEGLARKLGISLTSANRFLGGKAEPREPFILQTLAAIAQEVNMEVERDLFWEAFADAERVRKAKESHIPKDAYRRVSTSEFGIAAHSLYEWRLMAIARTAARYYPAVVDEIERVAGPATKLVDDVLLRANDTDLINYGALDLDIAVLGERRALEALKQEKNK